MRENVRDGLFMMRDNVYYFSEGLAHVKKDGEGFHIRSDGSPAYEERYNSVGPFSEGLAWAVGKDGKAFHIRPDGKPAYKERYNFVGSFFRGLATVEKNERWFHIFREKIN
jgi:hypothetical protein